MGKTSTCTYILWPKDAEISDAFFSACCPYIANEGFMIVHRPREDVEKIVEKTRQKGVTLATGYYS